MKQRLTTLAASAFSLMLGLNTFGAVFELKSGDGGAPGSVVASGQTNDGVNGTDPDSDTFNIDHTLIPPWAAPPGTSNWVSFTPTPTPGSGPSGIPNSGSYVDFIHSFTLLGALIGPTPVLTLYADDAADVTLNGVSIFTTLVRAQGANCNDTPASCVVGKAALIPLVGLTSGSNELIVRVFQDAGNGFGTAYSALIETQGLGDPEIPEPGSFALIGSGLCAMAYVVRRRRQGLSS